MQSRMVDLTALYRTMFSGIWRNFKISLVRNSLPEPFFNRFGLVSWISWLDETNYIGSMHSKKFMLKVLCVSFELLLLSCASNETHEQKRFREVIEGFPMVSLPLKVNGSGEEVSKFAIDLKGKSKDFADDFRKETFVELWGRIYPSDRYHYLIGSIASDDVVPVIIVFDKDGGEISREGLVSGMGAGPEGYEVSVATVLPDKSFIIIDSTFIHKYIEELDSIVAGSGVCTASVSKYRINKDGFFELVMTDTVRSKIDD